VSEAPWKADGGRPSGGARADGRARRGHGSGSAEPSPRRCRWGVALVALLVSSGPLADGAGGTERPRPFRIAALTTSWGPTPIVAGLRDGLLALGYQERKDFVLAVRFTQGDYAALPAAARQLVAYDADVIFVGETLTARAVQQASSRIPIVFAAVSDPVGAGLIQSFARPGGNVTGVSDLSLELGPKRLEVFRGIVPGLQRVLFPYDATNPAHLAELDVYRAAARQLGIALVERPLRTEEDARAALGRARKGQVDGILAPRCCYLNIPGFILEVPPDQAVPTMFRQAFWVERGALASYGADYYSSGRQAARLVDKILKGTKPAEIPVEANHRIEFSINRRTAQALGLTIPPEVLLRADRVVGWGPGRIPADHSTARLAALTAPLAVPAAPPRAP